MKKIKLIVSIILILIIHSCEKNNSDDEFTGSSGTFTDARDNHQYSWVKIGSQIWMAENLNYSGSSSWVYDNNSSNADIYGRLYDWETACEVCPDGWHLPSNNEWIELTDFLGGDYVAGGTLKETGTTHWNSPNTGASNSSGFSALPGGYRITNGDFLNIGETALFWSDEELSSNFAFYLGLHYNLERASHNNIVKDWGLSVRCLKDN